MKQLQEILRTLLDKLPSGRNTLEISELWGGSKALLLSELFRDSARPFLIVTATEEDATLLADDLQFFFDTIGVSERAAKPDILVLPP